MADNVPITAGSGTDIAADDIASVWYQRMKLTVGADGTATGDVAGATLDGGSGAGAYVIPRRPKSKVTATIAGMTTATTAYTAGDQLGTLVSLSSMTNASGGYGTITGLWVYDDSSVIGGLELYFFNASITPASDNAAFSVSSADMLKCCGSIIVPTPVNTGNGYYISLNSVNFDYDTSGGTTLYMAVQTLIGHTFFGAADDIDFGFYILKD